jgi:hypothetical protein
MWADIIVGRSVPEGVICHVWGEAAASH